MSRKIFFLCILLRKWKLLSENNSENEKFTGCFPARYPVPALPESEFQRQEPDIPFRHKYLVPVSLNPYTWLIRINHLYLYLQTIFIRSHVVKWESIQLAMPIKKKEKSLQCFNSFKDVSSLHQVLLYFTPWAAVFFKVIRGPWRAVQYFSIWKLCKSFSRQQIWNPLHCPPTSKSSFYCVKEESLYMFIKVINCFTRFSPP